MRVILMAAAIVAASISVAGAQELTEAQKNIVHHFAEAAVVSEKCPSLTVNTLLIGMSMAAYDIPDDAFSTAGPFRTASMVEAATALNAVAKLDTDEICMIGRILYGENGQSVAHLLIEK